MYFEKETLTRHVGLEQLMQTSLQEIEQKARKHKKHRFQNLYRLLNEYFLKQSWKLINKKSAAGVDKVSTKEFTEDLDVNMQALVENYNYYGIIENSRSLWSFYNQGMEYLYTWLNRRSQRRSMNWNEFNRLIKRYGVERPRIREKNYQQVVIQF